MVGCNKDWTQVGMPAVPTQLEGWIIINEWIIYSECTVELNITVEEIVLVYNQHPLKVI